MRKALLLLPLLFACAKSEPPAPPVEAPPAAPPALTEADIAGTWESSIMGMTSDSVVSTGTQTCAAGACKWVETGSKDSIPDTYMLMGDSVMGTSAAPYAKKGSKTKYTDSWVVHISGGKVTGTGETRLADKPDSVVSKFRITGTKKM